MKRPITIAEVARRANVAIGTVSNVLNGNSPVSDARRERVLSAIEELGFTPSMLASGMRRQRSRMIGLSVPDTATQNFSALVDALEQVVSADGFELIQVFSRQEAQKEFERIRRLLAYKVDGLMIVPSLEPARMLDHVQASGVPALILSRPVEDHRFDQVSVDHAAAIRQVAEMLVARGHRRLLLAVQYPTLAVTQRRLVALREMAAMAAKPMRVTPIEVGQGGESYAQQLGEILGAERAPTALIASSSTIAAYTIRALRQLGIDYPNRLSLIALDEPEWADLVSPQLSVVRQPTELLARSAWQTLSLRIKGQGGDPVALDLPVEIKLRGSVRDPA